MKMSELRDLDAGQLQQRLQQLQEELFNLRFQTATHQLTNHARMREVRRDIARVMTALSQRRLSAVGES
jgi:large subunit ribosomal protein L29